MNRNIFLILAVVFLILTLSGCDNSSPKSPDKPGKFVAYLCIEGYVYVKHGHGLAPLVEDGKFKECR